MKRLRVIVPLLVVSCGGFLPFIGDDDDDPPVVAPVADASEEVLDAPAVVDGFFVVDGMIGRGDSDSTCKPVNGGCTLASSCCSGLECRAAVCCVPGGLYANAAAECCSGIGDFDGFRGWRCREDS